MNYIEVEVTTGRYYLEGDPEIPVCFTATVFTPQFSLRLVRGLSQIAGNSGLVPHLNFSRCGFLCTSFAQDLPMADIMQGAIATRVAAIAFDLIVVGFIWYRCRASVKLLVMHGRNPRKFGSSTISATLMADGT